MNAKNNAAVDMLSRRKTEHIEISLERDVDAKNVTTGFERYDFIHQALPEFDLDDVNISVELLGKRLRAPLVISSMVGGVEEAGRINRNLAGAAQQLGLAMGVGSQRCAIEDGGVADTFRVRDVAPDVLLFANIGAVQLNYGYGAEECRRAVDMIGADALILHLNPLQEALQREGNTRFSGLLKKIESVCRALPVPVIAKEVCFGISEDTARRLASAGVGALDVAGAGGTSWSEVEKYRAASKLGFNVASSFASWGIPTAESIVMALRGAPGVPVIASGGVRGGLDVAKAMALGSSAAGLALPLLKAACAGPESVVNVLTEITEVLRIAMFCAGARDIIALRNTPLQIKK